MAKSEKVNGEYIVYESRRKIKQRNSECINC